MDYRLWGLCCPYRRSPSGATSESLEMVTAENFIPLHGYTVNIRHTWLTKPQTPSCLPCQGLRNWGSGCRECWHNLQGCNLPLQDTLPSCNSLFSISYQLNKLNASLPIFIIKIIANNSYSSWEIIIKSTSPSHVFGFLLFFSNCAFRLILVSADRLWAAYQVYRSRCHLDLLIGAAGCSPMQTSHFAGIIYRMLWVNMTITVSAAKLTPTNTHPHSRHAPLLPASAVFVKQDARICWWIHQLCLSEYNLTMRQ